MEIFVDILIAIGMLGVVASLGMGVYAMLRGGEYGLANYRRAVFDDWGLEQLTAHLAQQIEVLLAGANASAPPA